MCLTLRAVHLPAGPRAVSAKYFDELKFAARHASALACPGARYVPLSASEARRRAGRSAGHRDAGLLIGLPTPSLRT